MNLIIIEVRAFFFFPLPNKIFNEPDTSINYQDGKDIIKTYNILNIYMKIYFCLTKLFFNYLFIYLFYTNLYRIGIYCNIYSFF